MSLIARFVFDGGGPSDIELPKEEKEALLEAFNQKKIYHYKNDLSVFWCDMKKLSFFYIIPKPEVQAPPEA